MAPKTNNRRNRVLHIRTVAGRTFPQSVYESGLGVLDHLVRGLLARWSSQAQAARYLDKLRKAFVDWNEVRVSTITGIAQVLSRGGWTAEAAAQLKDVLAAIYADRQEVSLEHVRQMTPTHVRNALTALPHVDRVLADEIMLLAMGIPFLPYSEAVARMAHRLGLVPEDRITVRSQRQLGNLFEPQELPAIHYLFQEILQNCCLPELGRCEECPLIDYCPGRRKGRPDASGTGTTQTGGRKSKNARSGG